MHNARYVCSLEHFQSIKTHPLLGPALRLARCVNALRALTTAAVPNGAVPRNEAVRQSQNVLLHLGATLFESLEVLDDLGPDLGQLESAKKHLVSLRRDKELRSFRKHVLKPIRQTVAFHFDADVLPRAFDGLLFKPFVWSSHDRDGSSQRYYELADFSLIPAAFAGGEYASFVDNYRRYLNDTLVHCGYFCRAADEVLAEVASILGFALESSADRQSSESAGA